MQPSSFDRTNRTPLRLFGALLLGGALLAPGALSAQQGSITGVVLESGSLRPLSAVQVYIPGTSVGTLTDASGRYLLLQVPLGEQTVRAERVGYANGNVTVTVGADEAAVANFELSTTALELDEIVVTGTGRATEVKRLGNTVATISTESLENVPINSVTQLLTGREPGVLASVSGGMAGEGSTIRIRGSSSLSQSNQPIVYVDGVRFSNATGFGGAGAASRINSINPDAIARVEILKGAAAATLYGTEASGGVIQIFTKRGQAGTPRWEVSVEQGWSEYPSGRLTPHSGFTDSQAEADRLASFFGLGSLQPYEVFTVDLYPVLTETGSSQAYTASVSGGTDLINYFVSGRYSHINGPYGGEQFATEGFEVSRDLDVKKQGTAALTIFPMQNLRLRVNAMYTQGYHEIPSNGNSIYGGWSLLVMSKPQFANENNVTGVGAFTTVRETMQRRSWEDLERFTGGLSANFEPAENLLLDATLGVDMINSQGRDFVPYGWNVDGVSGSDEQGDRDFDDTNRNTVTLDAKASYALDLTSSLDADLLGGVQLQQASRTRVEGSGDEFPAPGLEVAGAGANQSVDEDILTTVNMGVYTQGTLGINNYLFLTGGVRYDKHSAFGETAGGAVYPKASASFVISDMPSWDAIGPISTLRLRAAYGKSGKQPGAFDKLTTFSPLPSAQGPGVTPDNLGNADLAPEVSTEIEAGLEVGLFDNRAALDLTYWNRTVDDVLVERLFAPSGGFTESQLVNLGQMKAWGVEVGLQGNAISRPGFTLDLFANGAFLREEVTSMGGAPPIKVDYYRYRTWIAEGFAPGSFFSPILLDAPYPFDTNSDGVADSREQVLAFLSQPRGTNDLAVMMAPDSENGPDGEYYRGKPMPDWQGAFGADITLLEDWRISTMFEYKWGNFYHQNLSGQFRNNHPLLGRNTVETATIESTLENPASTAEQRLAAAQTWARDILALAPYTGMSGAIEEADLLRWRELSITYTLPGDLVQRVGADRMSLTFAGRNLVLWTKYPGMDPDSNVNTATGGFVYGIDGWRPPIPRTFSFSARVGF